MEPANPPFPALRNFPFQPETGNQTSKRIYESLVGRIIPATRQNAGSVSTGRPYGGMNFPAGAGCAMVRVVSGSFVLNKVSQSAASEGSAPAVGIRTMAAITGRVAIVRMGSALLDSQH